MDFVAGIFAGVSCGIKYYGLLSSLALTLWIFTFLIRYKPYQIAVKNIGIFAVGGLIFASPFYLITLWLGTLFFLSF